MGNPLLGALVDAFSEGALNTSLWNNNSGALSLSTAYQWVQLPCTSTYTQLGSGTWNAVGASLQARITPAQLGSGSTETYMKVWASTSNQAEMYLSGGAFAARVVTGGVNSTVALPTYDPTQHAWWRIAESAGSFVFSTSPDGFVWTTQATIAYSWSAAAVQAQFLCGYYGTESGESAYIQAVNTTLPGTGLASWPKVQFLVAWGSNGSLSTPPSYQDLSSRLRGSWQAQLAGKQYELDETQSGQLTITLDNKDGALDEGNTSSPFYPNVEPLKPCLLRALWPIESRNLLPQGLAAASSTQDAQATTGSPFMATVTGVPTRHTTALGSTFGAIAALGEALGQGSNNANWSGQSDPDATPVAAGLAYTFSGWVAVASGGDAGYQVTPRISWYSSTGSRISTSDGTPVTAPVVGSWAQVVTTGTAPAGAVNARIELLNTNATTVTNTMYATALQLEQGSAATPWAPGPVIYGLWGGFVERWPQQWDYSGTRGLADLTCIDPLAALAQYTLQPSLEAGLLALGPDRVYPLDEPANPPGFRDITGKHGLGNVLHSTYGAGTVTFGSSVTGTGFSGAAGPVCTIANPTPSSVLTSQGSFLNLATPNGPPVNSGAGWTRIICFRTTTIPPSGTQSAIWWWSANMASNKSQGGIYVDANGHVGCTSQNSAGQELSAIIPGVTVTDGNWHMFAIILSQDGTTLNLNLDGAGYVATATFNAQPSGIVSDTIGMDVNFVANTYLWAYSGDVAYAVEVPTTNVPSFSDLASGFSTGWAGDTSLRRAQRILAMASSGLTVITQGTNTAAGGANIAGKDAMSALTEIADTEAGQLWADGSGAVRIDGRQWRYLQGTPVAVFGENQAAGEIPYLVDLGVDFDPTHIYNSVSITNDVAPGATQQPAATASNATSQTAYLPRTLQRTINANDPTMPQAQANYLAQQFGQPAQRVPTMTVDGAANPALWSQILPLTFGQRVTVNRRPPSGPGATQLSLAQFIEHMAWAGDDQGNLKLSLQVTPAAPYTNWFVVASLHSTLQVQATSGTNTITLGALTGANLNPASAVLSKGTVLTIGYGTAAAETVTVQSVAATSPGYTSVVVTLTGNLANTHASGAVVCQPVPSGVILPPQTAAGFPASLDAGATLSSTGPRVAY